jgi:hypothetical protein
VYAVVFVRILFIVNGILCYFPRSVILQGKQYVRFRNVDNNKVEARARVQHLLVHAFKKYILQFGHAC